MDNWQILERELARSRTESVELLWERYEKGGRIQVLALLASLPPRSNISCLSPSAPSPSVANIFGCDRTTNLLKNAPTYGVLQPGAVVAR